MLETRAVDGSAELMQLASLLRLGADTGRKIATLRPRDEAVIERLALRAEDIAAQLEMMVGAKITQSN